MSDLAKQDAPLVVSAGRPPFLAKYRQELSTSPEQWRVLVDAIFPSAKSGESIALALSYCRARGLDVMKRPVHIVPVYSSAKREMVETVWPGISELRTTAMRTREYAGIDPTTFGPERTETFTGKDRDGKDKTPVTVSFPEWAQVTVYRMVNGTKQAFHGPRVYWLETYASESSKSEIPNDRWQRAKSGQIEKCAEAAALRRAFPEEMGGEYAAEEMEGRVIDDARPADPNTVRQANEQAERMAQALKSAKNVTPTPPISSQEPPSSDDRDATHTEGSHDSGSSVKTDPGAFRAELEEFLSQARTNGTDVALEEWTMKKWGVLPAAMSAEQLAEAKKKGRK